MNNGNKDFNVTQVFSHRNGIAGRPFHTVHFTWKNGEKTLDMVAVLPVSAKHEGGDVECFVICPTLPEECWRGVHFIAQVRNAVLDHERSSEDRFRQRLATLPKNTRKRCKSHLI